MVFITPVIFRQSVSVFTILIVMLPDIDSSQAHPICFIAASRSVSVLSKPGKH